jgi:hypothetical protein
LFASLFESGHEGGPVVVTELSAWFYSSLAQVSAAIISIIGAVLLSKLSTQETETYRIADWIQREILDPHRREILSRAESVTDLTNLDVENVSEADRAKLAGVAERSRQLIGRARPSQTRALREELTGYLAEIGNPWARKAVGDQIRMLTDVEQRLQDYDNQSFPRTLWAVWVLLFWLTFVGVWWPLSVLPGIPGSWSRSLMLYGFLSGVLVFEAFLLLELIRMRWRRRDFVWRWSAP